MHIRVRYSEESLFNAADPADLARVDVPASVRRYGELLEAHLRSVEPEAQIVVEQGDQNIYAVDGRRDSDEVGWVQQCADEVYNGMAWWVAVAAELYEGNAGDLYLVVGLRAWGDLELTGSTFADDARAAVAGETHDWTVPVLDAGEVREHGKLVATFDAGEVSVQALPGRAATDYLGAAGHFWTPVEAARITGTAESGWRNRAAAGELPGAMKRGKQWLIPRSQVH